MVIKRSGGNGLVDRLKSSAKNVTLASTLMMGCINSSVEARESEKVFGRYDQTACNYVVATNGLIQGTIGAIGGYIENKPILKSFIQGATGGILSGASKCMVAYDSELTWPAKITNSIGSSISKNAVNGIGAFDSVGIDFGPLYVEAKKDKEGDYGVKPYVSVSHAARLAAVMYQGFEIDPGQSLKYANLVLKGSRATVSRLGKKYGYNKIGAFVIEGTIGVDERDIKNGRISEDQIGHELIHAMQYSQNKSLGELILNSNKYTRQIKDQAEKYHLKLEDVAFHSVKGINRLVNESMNHENENLKHDRELLELEPEYLLSTYGR